MIWKKKKDASAEAAETAEAKSGVSAFAKKNWKWLVPVVVVAAAGAVFLIGGGNKAASGDVTYAETTPVRQDVSNSLSGTGTLNPANTYLSLIHISEPTRRTPISYAVFCLKKKKNA